ncbi:hypothetical protein RND81_08G185000 [Saponaria officinalis]|uniref:Uncharacterized protein n=1 Tax=Saponaria officinalis TaxID=3572 RepID=A0AAW1J8X4_SAPOF
MIIRAHPELRTYIGLDVDPVAHGKAQARIDNLLQNVQSDSAANLEAHVLLKNFKQIKKAIGEVDDKLLTSGVDGILMDLGMSSMQAALTAEDILNSWPPTEVGRILREYGEESNWYFLQNKIIKARLEGGLHSTTDLVELIHSTTFRTKEEGKVG